MPTPPVTRKPIPQTPRKWLAEVKGIAAFLLKLDKLELDNGPKWVQKQYAYSTKRLLDLVDNPPAGTLVPTMAKTALSKATK